MSAVPHVYAAITSVSARLCEKGVGKSRKNEAQGYKFRGIDDFYNAMAPELAAARLCILPRCLSRDVVERTNAKGTALFYVTVSMEFDFVSAEDASKHTAGPFYGEAMDSGDKATNKAMSAAYKYCVMQAFAIPIEGQSVDSEIDSHEAVATRPVMQHSASQPAHDAYADLPDEAKTALREAAMEIIALTAENNIPAVMEIVTAMCVTHDDKLALWSLLPAPARAAIKKAETAKRAAQ